MGVKERLKELRETKKMSQASFAAKLGLQQKAISQIELGINNITEQNIIAICCVFDVNENWLRNGIGEMFVQTKEKVIEEVAEHFGLGDKSRELMKMFLEFDEWQREAVFNFIDEFTAKWQAKHKPPDNQNAQDNDSDETEVLKKYRLLDEQSKEKIKNDIDYEYERTKTFGEESSDEAIGS